MLPRLATAAALALFCLTCPALAAAEDAPADFDPAVLDQDHFMIGIGVGFQPSYEGSNDRVLAVVPGAQGRVSRINFALRGNRFSADLIPTPGGPGWDLQLGPVLDANFNRAVQIVDPQVKALGKHGGALAAGAKAGIARTGVITSDYDTLALSVIYIRDISGIHHSYVVTPSIDYSTPLSRKSFVGLSLSADYMGGGYAETYFSVDSAGSLASGLPVFSARKGWKDWTLGGIGAVSLTGDLTHGLAAVAALNYRRMLNDAAASPVTSIAGTPDQLTGIIGLAYSF